MCRHLAYLGPPVSLASLVLDPPHSLYEQSWAPDDMRGGGTVNADGFGLGWYADGVPVRYRRSVPIWSDGSLPGLARSVRSGAVVAAVRNGTTGMPHGEAAVAPFQRGPWFFSHNGLIGDWPESVGGLAGTLPVTDLLRLDAPLDSALLWALVARRLEDGVPAAEALASVVSEVGAVAPGSRLTVLLTDGEQLAAVTWSHALWVRQAPEAVMLSSEPWNRDDDGWQEIPDRSVLAATRHAYAITPLDGP